MNKRFSFYYYYLINWCENENVIKYLFNQIVWKRSSWKVENLILIYGIFNFLAGSLADVKVDEEEEPAPTNTSGGETILMNNGSRDTSHSDIQKLQQQLQDIKEQVKTLIYYLSLICFQAISLLIFKLI